MAFSSCLYTTKINEDQIFSDENHNWNKQLLCAGPYTIGYEKSKITVGVIKKKTIYDLLMDGLRLMQQMQRVRRLGFIGVQ